MKRIITIVVAMLVAASAMAETKFKYSVKAQVNTLSGNSVVKDKTYSYTDLRIRPKFTLGTEWVKSVLQLEIDQFLGADKSKDQGYADMGADQKGIVEVKSAYIDAKVKAVKGLSLTGGIKGYKFPGVIVNDVPMLGATYNFGSGNINLIYIKTGEGDALDNAQDDSQVYALDFTYKNDMLTIRPGLFLYQVGKTAENQKVEDQYKDSIGIIPALNLGVKADALTVDIAFAYATGKDKAATTEKKYSGFAVDAEIAYKVNKMIKLGAFFSMASGDDDNTDDDATSYHEASITGTKDIGFERAFIMQNGGSFSNGDIIVADKDFESSIEGKTNGHMIFGIMAKIKAGDFGVLAQIAYGQAAKVASGAKKDLGIEFDLNASYKINPDTKLFAEFAFLAAGDYYKDQYTDIQDAMYLNAGIKIKLK